MALQVDTAPLTNDAPEQEGTDVLLTDRTNDPVNDLSYERSLTGSLRT